MRTIPVTLTVQPREGFRFAGWVDGAGAAGVDPGSESVQVTLSRTRTVRATFEPLLCLADLDGSGGVDSGDAAMALLDFGPCGGCPADLDGSGKVDFADLAQILVEFGSCPGR
jgi:hypothetical protein